MDTYIGHICVIYVIYMYDTYMLYMTYMCHLYMNFYMINLYLSLVHAGFFFQTLMNIMLICEDGSLKILTANDSLTGLWTQPSLNPCSPFSSNKSSSKKKTSSKKGAVFQLWNGTSLSFRLTMLAPLTSGFPIANIEIKIITFTEF